MTERMQRTVDHAFEDVDAVLFVLSARERIGAGDRYIAQRVFSIGVPVVIVLNKVDNSSPVTSPPRWTPPRSSATSTRCTRSARRRVTASASCARASSDSYRDGPAPCSTSAAISRRGAGRRASSARRPFNLRARNCRTRSRSRSRKLGEKVARVLLYVETESQKQIVVGRAGSVVKEIGTRARPEIEHLPGHPVFLDARRSR